jgi:hypothetical protein
VAGGKRGRSESAAAEAAVVLVCHMLSAALTSSLSLGLFFLGCLRRTTGFATGRFALGSSGDASSRAAAPTPGGLRFAQTPYLYVRRLRLRLQRGRP